MKLAEKVIALFNDEEIVLESNYRDPALIVKLTIDKIRSLEVKYRVRATPSLDSLEKCLIDYIERQGEVPVKLSRTKAILIYNESVEMFKASFVDTLKAYTNLLKKAKEFNSWIDIRKMVEPLATIQVTEIKK